MDLSFTGTHGQKVDSKRRMSIPADLRRVLEQGDPQFEARGVARMYVLYGPHLKDHLQAYTVNGFNGIAHRITKKMKLGSPEQKRTARLILGHSEVVEVDRDGRVVLAKERREQIGLGDQVKYIGMGPHFEIWNKASTEEVDVDLADWLLDQGEDFDPLVLVPDEEEV